MLICLTGATAPVVMISPIRLRPIDWSIVQFAVLALCTVGGIYCAFHFGDSHEVARAILTLRERAEETQGRESAAFFPAENQARGKIEKAGPRMPPDSAPANLVVTQTATVQDRALVSTGEAP